MKPADQLLITVIGGVIVAVLVWLGRRLGRFVASIAENTTATRANTSEIGQLKEQIRPLLGLPSRVAQLERRSDMRNGR